MNTKLFSILVFFSIIIGGMSFAVATPASADLFPAGCSSALGNSVSTGLPCNGTATASANIAGCISPIGYSVTTGQACSGTTFAIQYLGGCTSIVGYSTATGAPCNGTSVATLPVNLVITPGDPATPGLPATGAGGQAGYNLALILLSGSIAVLGSLYLRRALLK